MNKLISNRPFIYVVLVSQLIPILAFSPESYSLDGQVWWLPVLLAVLVLISIYQLVFKGTYEIWPWYLIGFSNGFNIISRLMMFFSHFTMNQNGTQVINWVYIIISLICMIWSAAILNFMEKPEVKNTVIKS